MKITNPNYCAEQFTKTSLLHGHYSWCISLKAELGHKHTGNYFLLMTNSLHQFKITQKQVLIDGNGHQSSIFLNSKSLEILHYEKAFL